MTSRLTPLDLQDSQRLLRALRSKISEVIFGREELIDTILIAVLSGGHVLLEGLPGLGKTELIKAFSIALGLDVKRVQFTPDILPADITGSLMLNDGGSGEDRFYFQKGPIFTNLLLADEINRASPKTQSALLEAMAERRLTIMGESYALPNPFLVLATQNPIDLEGTYPLPEAQLDRFLMKIIVTNTPRSVIEKIIRDKHDNAARSIEQVMTREDLLLLMERVRQVYLPDAVVSYIARIIEATHKNTESSQHVLQHGSSPRGAIALASASCARALIFGRENASFDDVRALATNILRHRLFLSYESRIQGITIDSYITKLIQEVPAYGKEIPDSLDQVRQ